MKKSLREKFAFWLLKKRFTSKMYLMMDKTGRWQLSVRRNYQCFNVIDDTLAYELCLQHNINFNNFVKGETRLIANCVAPV